MVSPSDCHQGDRRGAEGQAAAGFPQPPGASGSRGCGGPTSLPGLALAKMGRGAHEASRGASSGSWKPALRVLEAGPDTRASLGRDVPVTAPATRRVRVWTHLAV